MNYAVEILNKCSNNELRGMGSTNKLSGKFYIQNLLTIESKDELLRVIAEVPEIPEANLLTIFLDNRFIGNFEKKAPKLYKTINSLKESYIKQGQNSEALFLILANLLKLIKYNNPQTNNCEDFFLCFTQELEEWKNCVIKRGGLKGISRTMKEAVSGKTRNNKDEYNNAKNNFKFFAILMIATYVRLIELEGDYFYA